MNVTFADFKKRCSTVCEILKTIEYLEPNESKKAYFEDAYFILDFLVSKEYEDIEYHCDSSIVRDILFHDLPKHRITDKYFEDFIIQNMPKYSYEEEKERYSYFYGFNSNSLDARVRAFDFTLRCYVEQVFVMVRNL